MSPAIKLPFPNAELLDSRPYSNHPGDRHLTCLLVRIHGDTPTPYVTWLYNAAHRGCYHDHYFHGYDSACADFLARH